MVSDQERIAHVVRRLGIGANPDLVAGLDSVDGAVAAMLDLSAPPAQPPELDPATEGATDYEDLSGRLMPWWFEQLGGGGQGLVERLTWFWHDHFAVSGDKVDSPYHMWQHHRLVRRLSTGNFADLLRSVATDPAMLLYLDGAFNAVDEPNENFGREVMELFTIGGGYTQADVREISRAFTGWVVNSRDDEDGSYPYPAAEPWSAVFEPDAYDRGRKAVFGRVGHLDLGDALGILLDRPETAQNVAAALYRELVGLDPSPGRRVDLGRSFAAGWSITSLVADIVTDPAFVADEAVRCRVRTPLEKAATLLQGLPRDPDYPPEDLFWLLERLHYLPLHPPNVAGFPSGAALLDPARLFGSFELLHLVDPDEMTGPLDIPRRLGLFDLSKETRDMLDHDPRPGRRLGLAFGSPEFLAT